MGVLKVLMIFFNFIFWLAGLALMILGGIMYALLHKELKRLDTTFSYIPLVILIIGLIIFIISFLGCCGAMQENACMLHTFSFLLGLIFLAGLVVGIIGFTMKKKVNNLVTKTLKKDVGDYENHKVMIDFWQSTFTCCGVDGPQDYNGQMTALGGEGCGKNKGVESCHKEKKCGNELYKKGCKVKVTDWMKGKLSLVAGVVIGIAFIPVLGIIFSCMLVTGIRGGYETV